MKKSILAACICLCAISTAGFGPVFDYSAPAVFTLPGDVSGEDDSESGVLELPSDLIGKVFDSGASGEAGTAAAAEALAAILGRLLDSHFPETLGDLADMIAAIPSEYSNALQPLLLDLCDKLLEREDLDNSMVTVIGLLKTNLETSTNVSATLAAAIGMAAFSKSVVQRFDELKELVKEQDAAALLSGLDPELLAGLLSAFAGKDGDSLQALLEAVFGQLSEDDLAFIEEQLDYLRLKLAILNASPVLNIDNNIDPTGFDILTRLNDGGIATTNLIPAFSNSTGYNARRYSPSLSGSGGIVDSGIITGAFPRLADSGISPVNPTLMGGGYASFGGIGDNFYGAGDFTGRVTGALDPISGFFDSGSYSFDANLGAGNQASNGVISGYYSDNQVLSGHGGSGTVDAKSFSLSGFQGTAYIDNPLDPSQTTLTGTPGGLGTVNVELMPIIP